MKRAIWSLSLILLSWTLHAQEAAGHYCDGGRGSSSNDPEEKPLHSVKYYAGRYTLSEYTSDSYCPKRRGMLTCEMKSYGEGYSFSYYFFLSDGDDTFSTALYYEIDPMTNEGKVIDAHGYFQGNVRMIGCPESWHAIIVEGVYNEDGTRHRVESHWIFDRKEILLFEKVYRLNLLNDQWTCCDSAPYAELEGKLQCVF